MQPLQRSAVRSAQRLRPHVQKVQRRYAGDSQGAHEKFEPHGGHNAHPVNESFGSGFFIALAAIPASFALYSYTRPTADDKPFITRYIAGKYQSYAKKWERMNDFHTQAVEQAGADRALFLGEAGQQAKWVDFRFPEQLNIGSPYNVPAGQGSVNIDKAIAKYEKEAFEANERRLRQLRENKVPIEQPFEPFVRMR